MNNLNQQEQQNKIENEIEIKKINENEIKDEIENQLKFWPEYELLYLFKNYNQHLLEYTKLNNFLQKKLMLEYSFKENPNQHQNYILKYYLNNNENNNENIIKYNLKHPSWSKTLFNLILTDEIQNEKYEISLFQSFTEMQLENQINQTGNGVCQKTLELYCYFFNTFNFENEINQSLITRIYNNPKINYKVFNTCYIFTENDYLIEDINNFIKYFEFENQDKNNENNEKSIYKKIEIIQSLLCLSNFLDCNLLYSFSISRMITYLKEL